MNHSDVQSRMADYLDGDLVLDERALVDAHLDACDSCALDLSELQGTVALLRSLPTPEPPPDLADSVIERLRSGEGRSRWDDVRSALAAWLTPPRMVLPATALAAAGFVLFLADGQLGMTGLLPGASSAESASKAPAPSVVARRAPMPDAAAAPKRPALAAARRALSSPSVSDPEPLLEHAAVSKPVLAPRAVFSSPGLAPSRSLQSSGSAGALQPVMTLQPRPRAGLELGTPVGREGQLDRLLDLLRRDPEGFAGWFGSRSAAERGLWLREFAEYASDLGIGDVVVEALRSAEGPRGRALSGQFAKTLEQLGTAPADPSPQQ